MNRFGLYPVVQPGVVGRILAPAGEDSQAVLLHPLQGKINVVNEVGARIWELINGQRSVADIARIISLEYSVTRQQAELDTLDFIAALAERQILSLQEQPLQE
jgi:hypothetical protein